MPWTKTNILPAGYESENHAWILLMTLTGAWTLINLKSGAKTYVGRTPEAAFVIAAKILRSHDAE